MSFIKAGTKRFTVLKTGAIQEVSSPKIKQNVYKAMSFNWSEPSSSEWRKMMYSKCFSGQFLFYEACTDKVITLLGHVNHFQHAFIFRDVF